VSSGEVEFGDEQDNVDMDFEDDEDEDNEIDIACPSSSDSSDYDEDPEPAPAVAYRRRTVMSPVTVNRFDYFDHTSCECCFAMKPYLRRVMLMKNFLEPKFTELAWKFINFQALHCPKTDAEEEGSIPTPERESSPSGGLLSEDDITVVSSANTSGQDEKRGNNYDQEIID